MGKKLFLPVVILILFCTGCAGNISIPKQQPEIDTKEPEQAAAVTPNTGFADMAGTDLTAYQTLDAPEDKVLYREIAEILGCMQTECEISAWEEEQISRVFACVMADHPEFFYVDGYRTQIYRIRDEVQKITFSGTYTLSADEAEQKAALMDQIAGEWILQMPTGLDDYGKVKYLYETVISAAEYDIDALQGQNMQSVFLYGKSVCQGYTRAFQYLCHLTGIPCISVSGTVNGQPHAWAMVCTDKEWYHVDPTWGDAAFALGVTQEPAATSLAAVNYDYLCVSDTQIADTHLISDAIEWPVCDSVANNYYRREGLYVESADTEQIKEILTAAREKGMESVTFQCADASVYQDVYDILLNKQQVLKILSADRVSYAESAEKKTLTFWLP
ncbi:MAG: hypothetical protein IKC46_08640 [Lachnospiraceae bacterium]|nr:hypothetical protein [Lachnospiraceae bacterium]